MTDRYETGMATRRAVLGDAYVDGKQAERTNFDAPFQQFVTEGAWGSVWSRDGISRRDRSLVTVALLAALGQWEELALHVRATAQTGATPEELREVLLHVAVYAGAPAANHAIKVVKATLAEMEAAR